jgi:arylsulfatase A-like enzyme/Flp pilus assembly protein TadD
MARRKRPHAPVSQTAPPSGAPRFHVRWRPIALLIVLAASLVVTAWWVARGRAAAVAPASRPNVLVITLDTTRADRIGSYGYNGASTVHLDRLAAEGVRFERALSPAPLTLPAHASLMTGRQPYGHGVRNNGYFSLGSDVPTLARALASAGYETAAFVSAFVLDRQFGLAQGFAHYDDALDRAAAGGSSLENERRGDRTVQAAVRWLATRAPGRPFFVWVHLFDPHDPYTPPSPFREQFAAHPYDGEIAFSDTLIGTLLDAVGYPTSPALVVVAGDHGESLGEHGESTHGLFVYEGALRVPLVMAGAGIVSAAVVAEPVRLIDVAPTVLDLLGLESLRGAEGRSLRPQIAGSSRGDDRPVYAETYFPQFFMGWAPLRALRVGRWKFIDAPEPELYDLSVDAGERTNVIAREPARADSLRRALASTLAAHADKTTPMPMSEDARQRLASLGYVSVAAPQTAGEARGTDPKRMVAVFERLLEGNRALTSGNAQGAAAIATEVLRQDAGNAFARLLQGRAALALNRNREAIASFEAYVSLVPQSADAHHWTALAALRLGDRERALAEEEAAVALDPRHTSAIALRAGLLLSLGRAEEGIAALRKASGEDPSNDVLLLELADLLTDARQFREAEAEYRRVLAAQPSNGRALAGLGLVLAATDRFAAALDPLSRAVDVNPGDEEARLARAEVLGALGRTAEARAQFEHLARTAARPDIRKAAVAALGGSATRRE